MTKKSSKQQSKQPSAANVGHLATIQSSSHPTSNSGVDTDPLAVTQLSFFNFITIATTEDIKEALELIATTSEGENLIYLWERAYKDGYESGRKSLLRSLEKNLEDRFEKGVEKRLDLGREEGYTVAKEAFNRMLA